MLDEFRSTHITWDKATRRIYSTITANESDENGRKLVVQIINGGQVEDLTGATLHLYWETRDKLHDGLDVFKAVDLKKGEFELSYTTGMLSNKGVLNANLVLIDTVGRVVSERFKITVTEGINNDAIQSENSFSSLTQALIDISNLEQNYAPRLNDLTAQLQHNTTNKVEKNGSGQIVYANLAQDVRTALTGGSVAVVGDDAVINSNLTSKVVTPEKTNFIEENVKNLIIISPSTTTAINSVTSAILTPIFNSLAFQLPTITDYFNVYVALSLVVGQQYTLKAKSETTPSNVRLYDSTKTVNLGNITVDANGYYTKTFTATETTQYLRFFSEGAGLSVSELGLYLGARYGTYHELTNIKLKVDSVDTAMLKKSSITPDRTTFIVDTLPNLIELTNATVSGIATVGGLPFDYPPEITNFGIKANAMAGYYALWIKLPLSESTVYTLKAYSESTLANARLYDSTKTVNLGDIAVDANGYYTKTFTATETTQYLRFYVLGNASEITEIGLYAGEKYGRYKFKNLIIDGVESNAFSGYVGDSFGDSITEGNTWQPIVSEKLGFPIQNHGVGGTTVANNNTSNYMATDTRINAIASNATIIFFMGGSNDWSQSIPIGTIEDTTDQTFYGAYQIVLNKIYSRCPNARVVLMLQPFRANMYANTNGNVLEDYREAVRQISKKYGYPLVNTLEAGINQMNYETFLSDVVHPNAVGGKRIAEVIIGKLKSIEPIA